MTRIRSGWLALAAVVAVAGGALTLKLLVHEVTAQMKPGKGDAAKGKALYEKKCAVCHGIDGKGDGPAEFVLFPKPRNLTAGVYKIRSTLTLPTDADLMQTITRGIPGTSMPSWASLSEGDRWDLVAYVKSLSPRFSEEKPGTPIRVPTPPSRSPRLVALGEAFYRDAGCFDCHGPTGRGDGPAAATLKDDWGYPIVPYDFTTPGRMKGGSTLKDIYRTLSVGIGGTPMPSYADSLDERERWELAHYVLSLAGQRVAAPAPVERTALRSRFVSAPLPTDPSAPLWRQATPVAIVMRTLWLRPKEIDAVRVASLHTGKEIGFLLEWDDPIFDQDTLRHEDFRDAAAIQFPHGRDEPTYIMGERDGPVNIWHWKADWQADLARFRDIQDQYPHMAWDDYPFVKGLTHGDHGQVHAATASHNPTFLAGWGAGNLFSAPRRLTPVENLNAVGLGTLTAQPPEHQTVRGHGTWTDGKWRVVMVRALRTANERDVQFEPGTTIPVAFAVWDGAQGDRDGRKAVATWQQLTLEKPR
jgi:mono/diheme cytochrome c family protein